VNRRDVLKSLSLMTAAMAQPALLKATQAGAQGKARLRTGLVAYSFRDELQQGSMTYQDLVRLAARLDVDGLDLTVYWFPNTSDDFLLPLRRLAYKTAVEIYSISIRTDMCQSTRELQEKEVVEIRRWVDVAEKLGASHIRVFGGEVPPGSTEDQAASWVVEILKRAAEYSGGKGIILGLENHGGITEKARRVLQIIKQVNSPWVGMNLDTGNFPDHAYAQIEECIPSAVNVQYKTEIADDSGKRGPADWDRITAMFAKAGYQGYLGLEYEDKEKAGTAVPRLMEKLRQLTRKYSR
jgi:L-ribulose-5-phosphate 3-epimerase